MEFKLFICIHIHNVKRIFFLVLFLFFYFFPQKTFAAIVPVHTDPANNSSTDTPKLSWQYSGSCITPPASCFRVQVASSSAFSPNNSSTQNSPILLATPIGTKIGIDFTKDITTGADVLGTNSAFATPKTIKEEVKTLGTSENNLSKIF